MAKTFEPTRMEAFSDGVIAVIITIMVLELKVPRETGMQGFRAVLPTLLVYALSFVLIGIYWVNHHELIGRLRRCNNRILWANLLWMFALSLIPFFTAWLLDHKLDPLSVQMYAGCQLLAGATFLVLRYAIDCQLHVEGRTTQIAASTRLKHWSSLAIYIVAVLLAPRVPRFALALAALVAALWIVPTLALHAANAGNDETRRDDLRTKEHETALHSSTE